MKSKKISKIWIVVLLLALIFGGVLVLRYWLTSKKEIPGWAKEMIVRMEIEAVANPPALLERCNYRNQTVYYLPPRCCDVPSKLYSKEGDIICLPGGGYTGKGDGRCKDFSKEKKNCEVIWEDIR